jgi:hypothetical protein
MSFQDSNQQPFAPPPQQPGQSWGQQPEAQQQGSWGGQPQQQPQQAPQAPQPPQGGSGAWGGSQQPQIPQQPSYGFGQQSGGGQSFGQPQDYVQQNFPQQGYPQQGYPNQGYQNGQPGYPPQSDFGPGGYGPNGAYPGQGQNQGNSGLATTALWLGILGGWGLINLVIAILAINDTAPGKKLGRGKAITGLCLTLAWSVVFIGIAIAVSSHTKNVAASAAPTSSVVASSTATGSGAGAGATPTSTGAGGLSAGGASNDPGCQAAQTAFNTYNQNASSGGLQAIATLGNALESAAGQSQVASSQLKTMGQDYVQLSNATDPSTMVSDLEALDSACGISFSVG